MEQSNPRSIMSLHIGLHRRFLGLEDQRQSGPCLRGGSICSGAKHNCQPQDCRGQDWLRISHHHGWLKDQDYEAFTNPRLGGRAQVRKSGHCSTRQVKNDDAKLFFYSSCCPRRDGLARARTHPMLEQELSYNRDDSQRDSKRRPHSMLLKSITPNQELTARSGSSSGG